MKILQVSHGLPPKENAGVELYTYYLSRALAHLGHDVSILCREEDPEKEEFSSSEEVMDGLRVTRVINNLTRIDSPRTLFDNPFFDQIFLRILRQENPDLIHFQHFIGLSANLLKIAKEQGYPVLLTLHDFFILCHRIQLLKRDGALCPGPLYGLECVSCLDSISSPQDFRTRLFLRMKQILPFPLIKRMKRLLIPSKFLGDRGYEAFHRYRFMYEIFKIPEIVLAPSRFVQETFLKYYPVLRPKMRVLPLGIAPIDVENHHRKRSAKIRFCYFGNLLPYKGVHVLIDAFKRLPRGKATLTIYGEKKPWRGNYEYYGDLTRQDAEGSIHFQGPFKRENLAEALSDQDVAVLPSLCPESFSLAIREANSLGLPVIASRIGAIPEAVEDGRNGFLFEAGDKEALIRHMLRFIEEPDLIRRMSCTLPKAKLMDEYAIELEKIYASILRREGKKTLLRSA
jgi:glycosyltransferase involved in cell wall biosynthesis